MVRTRIVCVSDTHAYSPTAAGFKLPQGDVLIHAGDITNRGSLAELRDTIDWIEKADFQAKIVVAGVDSPVCSNNHANSFYS
jgi:predicted phosphodiesterase